MLYLILTIQEVKDEKANPCNSSLQDPENLKKIFGSGVTWGRKAVHPPKLFGGQAGCRI